MSITLKCPHDGEELEKVPSQKSPDSLLQCPKCHCYFRVCLTKYDRECYKKMNPTSSGGEMLTTPFFTEKDGKRKRGRPPKVMGSVAQDVPS